MNYMHDSWEVTLVNHVYKYKIFIALWKTSNLLVSDKFKLVAMWPCARALQ